MAYGLLTFANMGRKRFAGGRIATYSLAFVFLLSSVAYACPDVHHPSAHSHHSTLNDLTADHDPCGGTGNEAPHSVCYQALHDRLLSPLTEFLSPLRARIHYYCADDATVDSDAFSFFIPSRTAYHPPPKVALNLRFNVLRI